MSPEISARAGCSPSGPCSVESHTCTSAPKGSLQEEKMKEAVFFKDDTREKTEGVRNEETSEGRQGRLPEEVRGRR